MSKQARGESKAEPGEDSGVLPHPNTSVAQDPALNMVQAEPAGLALPLSARRLRTLPPARTPSAGREAIFHADAVMFSFLSTSSEIGVQRAWMMGWLQALAPKLLTERRRELLTNAVCPADLGGQRQTSNGPGACWQERGQGPRRASRAGGSGAPGAAPPEPPGPASSPGLAGGHFSHEQCPALFCPFPGQG